MTAIDLNFSEANSLYFLQKLRFKDDDTSDNIAVTFSKRRQTLLNYYLSFPNNERKATCYLLSDTLHEYSKTVDDLSLLNGYSQYIKSVKRVPRCHLSDRCEWKNSLSFEKFHRNFKDSEPFENPSDDIIELLFSQLKKKCTSSEYRKVVNRLVHKNISPNQNAETYVRQKVDKFNISHTKLLSKQFNSNENTESNEVNGGFRTAKNELKIQNMKKYGNMSTDNNHTKETLSIKRTLGGRSRSVNSKFVPPIKNDESPKSSDELAELLIYEDERLKNLDPKMIELIKNEIMDHGNTITWDDIAGLQFAKATIQEIVVWPLLRPDIFTGLRRPPKGILLFGPPGTGKTLIGKCIASQSSSTFFSISASSLTSKWIGESEKLVRTLFAVARCHQPAVIFIDEIDSLLSQRSETEHESSRRVKTEFLVQLDGATTQDDDRILVIGATNRPQELDEAARRRLVKRLYIPLPRFEARCEIVNRLMSTEKNDLAEKDIYEIAKLTDGYSGADMKNLCQEASLGPIRSIDFNQICSIESHQVRPVTFSDFISALQVVRSSVSAKDLDLYLEWDKMFGSSGN